MNKKFRTFFHKNNHILQTLKITILKKKTFLYKLVLWSTKKSITVWQPTVKHILFQSLLEFLTVCYFMLNIALNYLNSFKLQAVTLLMKIYKIPFILLF